MDTLFTLMNLSILCKIHLLFLKLFIMWRQLYSYFKTREQKLIAFFAIFLLVTVARLFWLQVLSGEYYQELLVEQHTTSTTLKAKRGHIYVEDKAWTQMQLTENVDLFTLFVDPKFLNIALPNRSSTENIRLSEQIEEDLIKELTPIITDHLCVQYWVTPIDKRTCIKNIQDFTKKELLPNENTYYTFSWDTLLYTDNEEYTRLLEEVESQFDREAAEWMVQRRLEDVIRNGIREYNYIWRYDSPKIIERLKNSSLWENLSIIDDAYIYINPSSITSPESAIQILYDVFQSWGETISKQRLKALMQPQEIRYIRITTWMNSKIAKRILEAKSNWYDYWLSTYWVPLFHWVWLEEYQERYYPHNSFMANILWYVTWAWESFYGVEKYFDELLKGKDWKILGLATPWIWEIWANNFEIAEPVDGNTITLTIDPVIQKEIENAAWYFTRIFNADSVAITIIDPNTWEVKWLANSPTFDPNDPNSSYKLRPIRYDERYLLDDTTFIEIPVFTLSGAQLIQTTTETRTAPGKNKYIFENYLWPQVFIDKNISFPYEPWSIFKTITLAIWIDSNSIASNEFYQDDGKVTVWPFTIANISKNCLWLHTFSHALWYSCNVWMVRIAQRVTKYVFYEYLKALGFWELTGIELAWEEWWTLPNFNVVSKARFFNNTYGQWMLATPLQMAIAYAATINGWTYLKPTVIKSIYSPSTETHLSLPESERIKVFSEQTSQDTKDALVSVIDDWWLQKYKKEWYALGWKTWTSEIAFKWKYQSWAWRTNGSFVGIVTAKSTNYVVAIQVRRPRTSPRWSDTAWRIFSQLSDFLIAYDAIDE